MELTSRILEIIRAYKSPFLAAFVAALVVTGAQVIFYWDSLQADRPINYTGDSLAILAQMRAVYEGNFPLGLPKKVQRLNAPYEAWWGDYPITDLVYWLPGQFIKDDNLFTVANWAVIGGLAVSAAAFTLCAIALGSTSVFAVAFGILFGVAPYGFVRQLEHLMLTWYFCVPINLYIVLKLRQVGATCRRSLIVLCCLSLFCGLFNPYYIAMFLVLLAFISMGFWADKNWQGLIAVFVIICCALLGFFLQNLDTFLLRLQEGQNPAAVSRDLWWMVKFGLYLPDLILPKFHTWDVFRHLAGWHYQYKIPVQLAGESQTAYIGIVATISLACLAITGCAKAFSRKSDTPFNPYFVLALVVFVFAVVGGLNYLLGALGFQLLRASNRYSIILMAIGLFAASVYLSQTIRKRILSFLTALGITIVGIWDQIPKFPDWVQEYLQEGWHLFEEDKQVFSELEERLPRGAMVFQLPVHLYPESGPVNKMGDYEHFRPYLHTKTLRFSYGTVKGRPHAAWQNHLDFEAKTQNALDELKNRHFSAILINRRAYTDRADHLKQLLLSHGCSILMQSESYYALLLPKKNASQFE